MQTALSKIWTWINLFISYDGNYYTLSAYIIYMCTLYSYNIYDIYIMYMCKKVNKE